MEDRINNLFGAKNYLKFMHLRKPLKGLRKACAWFSVIINKFWIVFAKVQTCHTCTSDSEYADIFRKTGLEPAVTYFKHLDLSVRF